MFEMLDSHDVTPVVLHQLKRLRLKMDEQIESEDMKAAKW